VRDLRNADSRHKHNAILEHVLHLEGGLLMSVDADDVCLVEAARRRSPLIASASSSTGVW
jgi:hypothetical protein